MIAAGLLQPFCVAFPVAFHQSRQRRLHLKIPGRPTNIASEAAPGTQPRIEQAPCRRTLPVTGSLTIPRRADLDAVRAFAMLLGIALHAALSFATIPWIVQDSRQNEWFTLFVEAVHGFRMPLFFLVSGFFTAMVWRRRGLGALLKQRAMRILLPLVLGGLTVIPATNAVCFWAILSAINPPQSPSDDGTLIAAVKKVTWPRSGSVWTMARTRALPMRVRGDPTGLGRHAGGHRGCPASDRPRGRRERQKQGRVNGPARRGLPGPSCVAELLIRKGADHRGPKHPERDAPERH